jgi:DNA topoisomerase I
MKLVIIESPNKIKKLKSILSSDYEIVASVGHLFDLPKKELGIDLQTFDTELVIYEDKKDILANIKRNADLADVIYLASDMDREGSGVSKNIFDSLTKKNQKKCKRLLINAITKEAVEAAIKNPTTIDLNLCNAQKGRRVTDRLVGYQISPVMWTKGLKGTSAGRVQSVALKYVADLEKEVLAFKSEEYWKATLKGDGFAAELATIDGSAYNPKTKAGAEAMRKDILSGKATAKVSEYSKKVRTRSPEPPFITSTVQQVASNLFGWNAQKTMQVAQTLFAAGLITYLRTDSTRIEPDKIKSIREKVEAKLGANYISPSPRAYSNKDAAQDAHEAIRPTYDQPLAPLAPDETKLLGLIDKRFKASQMADATFDQASLKIEIKSQKHTYIFRVNGSIMTFEGFLKVYGENKEDLILPSMSIGSGVEVFDIVSSQHFTQPPGRYSDASLIKKLEKEGVGRPSTYASIIETLINRGYASRDKKSVHATELGMMVSDYLSHSFPLLVSPEMTAKMETDLDEIASGKGDYLKIMTAFHTSLATSISEAKKINPVDIFRTDRVCTECESPMVKRKGEYDIFFGCSAWPKCGHTIKIGVDGEEVSESEETAEPCPECGGALKERMSKFGKPFFGCGNYPVCKYIKSDKPSSGNKSEITKVKCTKCKDSLMRKITMKDGSQFLGCCSYPTCKGTVNLDKNGNVIKYK